NSHVYVRFQVMSDIGNIYLYYYLSSNFFPSANDTYNGYFDVRGSLNSWINIDQNLTNDFISVFPTRVLSQCYIRSIYFDAYSIEQATGPLVMLFDDVSLTNDTAYDYYSDNGDFEVGDGSHWTNRQTDSGYAYLTENDYTQGSKAMNLTAYSTTDASYSTAYVTRYHSQGYGTFQKGLFAQQSGEYLIDFNWKHTDTSSTDFEYSYFYLSCENETFTANIYIILGDSKDSLIDFTNYTAASYWSRYIKAENFSIANNWNHFSIDYFDLLTSIGLSNLTTTAIQFTAYSEGADAKVQLLVDELSLLVYPLSDPSFENNWEWQSNDPLLAWVTNYNDDYVNRTSDAFSGNYAANVTSYGGVEAYCQRNMFLPVDDNQFLDFRWKLDKITNTGTGSAYSHIAMQIDGGARSVYYVLGRTDTATYTNNSGRVCFYVENMNTTGSWLNLYRNLSEDIIDVFGDNNWNITTIQLNSQADGTTVVSTIFDDLHFVEDNAGPTITSPTITPSLPENDDSVDVSVDVVDSSQVNLVELHYQIGTGSWIIVPMTFVAGEYVATIPSAVYGETVNYYFTAEDVYGFTSQLGTESSSYSYVVGDDTFPDVIITSPIPSAVVANNLLIEADVEETGSGIDYVEFSDGSTLLGTDSSAPYSYLWNTRTAANGEHTIIVMAYDNAGLANSSGVIVNLDNDFDAPEVAVIRLIVGDSLVNEPVEVRAEVYDASALNYVKLFYRANSGPWVEVAMTFSVENYTGMIPAFGAPTLVEYYVKAQDIYYQVGSFTSALNPLSYEIEETPTNVGKISFGVIGIIAHTFFLVRINKRRKVA
ncbi:MAG: Ig-like domain-containing protein, partial [Candidatus Heimdallarchaeota archaeon]